MAKLSQTEFQQRTGRIEKLIEELDGIPDPALHGKVKDLVQSLLDLHGAGLERMLDLVYESSTSGQLLIDTLARDELVGSLLLLHGLHPLSLAERVTLALEKVRPYMKTHGGNVELLEVSDDGVVLLRLEGSCHECPSSRVTLKYAVEDEIYKAAPDVTAIRVEGVVPERRAPSLVPAGQLLGAEIPVRMNDGWVTVDGIGSLDDASTRALDVSGLPVLFCRMGDSFYAYGNRCPNCRQPLGQATLAGKDLTCAACGHRYDVMRAGRDMDDPHLHLEPFPLLSERGQVRVAVHA